MTNQDYKFLEGGGEMGELIRSIDWSKTPVGPVDEWPQSLRITISIVLNTPFPMYIAWGNEYTQFYNDGYRPILGSTKHPQAMGISSRDTFAEIWHIIESMFNGVMQGIPVGFPNFMVPLNRHGYLEECYFDFSYSPIRHDNGDIGGVLVTVIETTDKINNLKNLKQSRDELQFAINAAELGTWDLNPETNNLVINDRLKEWFGIIDSSAINFDQVMRLIAEKDRSRVNQAVHNALQPERGGNYDVKYALINPLDGKERVVHAKGKAFFNEDGIAYKLSGTLQDITKDITYQEALVKNEANFRNMVINAPVAMCIFREPNYIVEVANQRMFELWGKKPKEVLHKPIFDAMPEVREQGLEQILLNVYTTGERFIANERPVKLPRDGKIETIYVNFVYEALHDADNRIYGIAAVAIDVTEQVNARHKVEDAEERARLAIEAADMGTFDFNLITHEVIASPRFNEIYGLDKPASHHDYVSIIHPEDLSIRDKAHDDALKTGRLSYVVRIIKPDKAVRWIQAEGKVYYNNENQPVRLLGTTIDITEQKYLQQQKDDFIGVASHELKTPMTSLKASLQLLTRKINSKDTIFTEALLAQSNNSLNKLSKLIEDLLNATKIKEGHLILNKSQFNIAGLINDCCQYIRSEGDYNIVIEGDKDLEITADASKIDQVIINLVNNAIKYASNSKNILFNIEKLNNYVRLSVTDYGPGIPNDRIPHLFERYYQVDNKGVQFAGLGLGLYISAEIIKKHGGEMGVESILGEGSTFWFTLPL